MRTTAAKQVIVAWENGPVEGKIEVVHGTLAALRILNGDGQTNGVNFAITSSGSCRLMVACNDARLENGSGATRVTIRSRKHPFTFFLRDVRKDLPILIPAYGAAVTIAEDERRFEQIQQAVRERGLLTGLQRIDDEPEESYEAAAANTRELRCPIWLGISRDMRIFEMGLRGAESREDWLRPRFHGHDSFGSEPEPRCRRYGFVAGRGWGCTETVRRGLDGGVLPIFRWERIDGDIRYKHTAFATLERTPLTAGAARGTHFLVADGHARGHTFTEEQEKAFQSLLPTEMNQEDETVLCCRVEAANAASVPRYAFLKAAFPQKENGYPLPYSFDGSNGFGISDESDLIFAVSKLDGNPMPQEEVAVLLATDESCVLEFFLPHRPIPEARAEALAKLSFPDCLRECRDFWNAKLAAAARIALPEKRVDEMARAGLLHLDMVTYGLEPEGTLAPTIGVYSPIGSESAPIINFFDSMGRHDIARRAVTYFLDKQHEDGFMQNFDGYMLETGCALWIMGEHYRYTRDEAWVAQIKPKVLKSCQFLLRWRARNQREDLRGHGYGMMEGKVGDPEDQERTFMLNGHACLGLSRVAEMLAASDPAESERLREAAKGLKEDIRAAFLDSLARGPVVPLGDGTWCPTAAPWAGADGPTCLFAEEGKWYTHGAVTLRDSLTSPLYLVFQEIIEPGETVVTLMLDYHSELLFARNVAFSQPYYSRHPFVHLRRGETKQFLKAYYNGFAGLADRETYSFWEHYFHVSPHKTHEEAWFLMQTRWMLYMEDGETLKLLRGVPRAWLEHGKRIELRDVASYFGPLSLVVTSKVDAGFIEAEITCASDRRPEHVEIRLPHPLGKKAVSVEGGVYDAEREALTIEKFGGHARVRTVFEP